MRQVKKLAEKNKRYYWLRLKRDFFKRHDIQIIEGMDNGKDYILFYLKLLCESVDHEGNLRFSDEIPYNDKMLATITRTNIDIVRSAVKIFTSLGMMELLDDGTFYMSRIEEMIGSETYWAEKKRIQRNNLKLLDNVQPESNTTPTCPSKSKSIEIEKEIDIDKKIEKEKKSKGNGGGGVVITDNNSFKLVANAYENNIGTLSGTVIEIINYYLDEGVEDKLIVEAIKVACMNNKRTMSYTEGVLKNWLKDGISTVERYKALLVEKEALKANLKSNDTSLKINKFNSMDTREIDFDEIERLERERIDRILEKTS